MKRCVIVISLYHHSEHGIKISIIFVMEAASIFLIHFNNDTFLVIKAIAESVMNRPSTVFRDISMLIHSIFHLNIIVVDDGRQSANLRLILC
jgi:hypothetical protein